MHNLLIYIIPLILTVSHDAMVSNIFKVDGGHSVVAPSLDHAASQAPLLSVRAELQDLITMVTIPAAWGINKH